MDTVHTSRLAAAKARQKTFLGRPCPDGHNGLRYTSSGQCVECTKARGRVNNDAIRRLLRGEEPAP